MEVRNGLTFLHAISFNLFQGWSKYDPKTGHTKLCFVILRLPLLQVLHVMCFHKFI
jgi:hypothetical protein